MTIRSTRWRAELVRLIEDEAPAAEAAQLRVTTSMWTLAVRERTVEVAIRATEFRLVEGQTLDA